LRTQRNDHPIKVLEDLADTLVQKGVKYVDGDLVADDSYFAFERYGEGWSQDDLVWGDGAPVSALAINDNVVFVSILPRIARGIAPSSASLPLPITTGRQPDYDHSGGDNSRIFFNREPDPRPLRCGAKCRWTTKERTKLWPSKTLRRLRRSCSGACSRSGESPSMAASERITRNWRGCLPSASPRRRGARREGDLPHPGLANQALVLATYESKPLIEDIRVINKVSQTSTRKFCFVSWLGRRARQPRSTMGWKWCEVF